MADKRPNKILSYLLENYLTDASTISLTALCVALVILFYGRRSDKSLDSDSSVSKCRSPPTLKTIDKIFGLDFLLRNMKLVQQGRIMQEVISDHVELGNTFRVFSQRRNMLYTIDPENLRAIYETRSQDWSVEPHRLKALGPLCGAGHITADGEESLRSDEMLKSSLANVESARLSALKAFMNSFLDQLPVDGQTFDIAPLVDRLFLDVDFVFLFGYEWRRQYKTISEADLARQAFLVSLEAAQFWGNMRILFGIMGRICSRFVWQKHYRHVHRFVDDQIEDAAKDLDGRQRRSRFLTPQGGLINGLLRAGYDRDRIRFQAIQILILMRETTSTLVNNTLSLLSKRPDIWNELRQELMKSQDSKTSTKDGDESSLIHRCIKESLRLYPVVGQSGRTALHNTCLPAGGGSDGSSSICVPAGCMTFNNFFALHRRSKVYGEDVETFNPYRWAEISPAPTEYMPFGHGRRRCAGEQKALQEAYYMVERLALRFRYLESRDDQEWLGEWKLVVKARNGCRIRLLAEEI